MRIHPAWILLVALFASGAGATEVASSPEGDVFGAPPTLSRTTPLAEIMRDPAHFEGQTVLLHGRISDVCQRKGCWTVIRDGDAHVRVRFEDYGFFLPKDSIGAEAWAQGSVSVVTLSEGEARHYESESRGGDPNRIDGPVREVRFTASGVRLVQQR
jgi:hypothetical protein